MENHILDSSAIIEILDDGPNTKYFRPIIKKHPDILVPAIIITEVRKVILRQRTQEEADLVTRSLLASQVINIDESIATTAADLAIKHNLPLADSLIYAITVSYKATLWTQDSDFKGLPKVRYYPKVTK